MDFKDTFFSDTRSINIRGRLMYFQPALIMGILNITPDSFYAGSRLNDPAAIRRKAAEMIDAGAEIIDVGAWSSRPGAGDIPEKEELSRLDTALAVIRESFPGIIISVDTCRSAVARKVVKEYGVDMINDVSGGNLDQEMFTTVADLGVPYVLMHMKGHPSDMQEHAVYKDVVREIIHCLSEKVGRLNRLGVNDVIIDPGFGFAKTTDHNFEILNRLESFRIFNQPLLVGLSRKSMVYRTLECTPDEALNGSTVLHTIALMKGADILRVHDVREARESLVLYRKMMEAGVPG
jgi:dihydropteroate synthase